nr:glycosyltransferase [Motilibacter deserti]
MLSYSTYHFDPERPPDEHEHWASSASILARTLHAILGRMGEVIYVDAFTVPLETLAAQQFDVCVGIVDRFDEISRASGARVNVVLAVNSHPRHRTAALRAAVADWGLPETALAEWDLPDAAAMSTAISRADAVICVGNTTVLNTYLANGVPPAKVKVVNYGTGPSLPDAAGGAEPSEFVHVASEIGLRKGFDIVHELFTSQGFVSSSARLTVIGRPVTPFHEQKLAHLQDVLGDRLTAAGWVESSSAAYDRALRRAAFVVSPALEEGQAGAVLDAMRRGAVPLLTPQTGIDFSPLGWLEPRLGSAANAEALRQAVGLDPAGLARLRAKTLDYYRGFHEEFEGPLEEAVRGALHGELHPKVSVTLPVFNKEGTIRGLLGYLDRALKAYPAGELHVVLDGCKDQTEQVVRRFYAGRRSYPVTFEVTPDIFEVRTNNIGLRKSTGKYCVILQDDNYVYDRSLFYEAVTFLDKNPRIAVLGCLAGVNLYPRGTTGLDGPGQVVMSDVEVYWRQDARTDPALGRKFFQVDACMRGPLVLRKSFLEEHGYLDEAYAPFYMDDMDIAMRATSLGYQVYAMLGDVENRSLTIANYDDARNEFWERTIRAGADLFYSRWTPSVDKDYLQVERVPVADPRRLPLRDELRARAPEPVVKLARLAREPRRVPAALAFHLGRVTTALKGDGR